LPATSTYSQALRPTTTRNRRLELLATLIIAFPIGATAEVEKFAVLCENSICPHWWPMLKPPAGWHHDRHYSVHYNINALVQDGQSFNDAETVMYANAVFKPRVPESKTLTAFIENNQAGFRQQFSDISIIPATTLTTSDRKPAEGWMLKPTTKGQWE
jgi:hypothetical protein